MEASGGGQRNTLTQARAGRTGGSLVMGIVIGVIITLGIVLIMGLIIGIGYIIITQSGSGSGSGSSSSYSLEKTHYIIGSPDGALSDYQMKFIVHSGNGVDNGQDVYLNGNSQSWPNDIRFSDANNNPYSYWIESYDANTAIVWVKISGIPETGTTIKLHYGKANDAGQSIGDNTFVFFDDFDGSTLDTSKWYVYNAGTGSTYSYSVRNGELYISAKDSTIFGVGSKTKVGPYDYAFEMKVKSSDTGGNEIGADYRTDGNGPITFAKVYHDGGTTYYTNYNDGRFTSSHRSTSYRNYQRLSILWAPSYVKYLESGDEKANISTNVPESPMGLNFAVNTDHADHNITVDWAAIRKYTQNEPAHGSWSN